ncbi:MAG: Gfo/Idh/MocA family oxidoreductase [Cyclobacteriaceae bacterium]
MIKHLEHVKWGIIGVGDVCEVKSAPAIQLIPDSSIQIVMRRDEAKVRDYAKRHNVPEWTIKTSEVINHPEVNAIYVATPPAYHAQYTIAAAKAGKPVYVEKPMARTSQECQQMIRACEEAGVPLLIAYYRRALPHVLKVKELLDSKTIGDIRFVKIELYQPIDPNIVASGTNWRVDPEIAGGGYFYDLASHQLDLLDFLLGPIHSGKGYSGNQAGHYEAEDIVTGVFKFESGVLGSGIWSFAVASDDQVDRVTIHGSEGHIEFTTFGATDVKLVSQHTSETFNFDMPKHIQQPLIQQVVDELRGKGTCVSTGFSGARANQVMEWISK